MAAAPGLAARLNADAEATPAARLRISRRASAEQVQAWWAGRSGAGAIADDVSLADLERYRGTVENFVGTVKVPVGIAGPLRVNGLHASGDYLVPLATTEAALVASFSRGAEVITRAGGAAAALLSDAVVRTPAFVFDGLGDAGRFIAWAVEQSEHLAAAANSTTRHGRLEAIDPYVDSDTVFLVCRYATGDAAGQNMVTIATEEMCQYIVAHCPVPMRRWFIEGNFSGDKKASYLGLLTGRGRKVSASVVIPDELVGRLLHTTPEAMLDYSRVAQLGALLSGQIGAQGQYANGLAALYIATGQDAACVAESATGFTRMERREGGLFMSVTLPNLLVGTVGGGTGLPSQSAALDLMGLRGTGKAPAFAEVAGALVLAGEISIMAAIAASEFTRAHQRLARGRT